MDEVLERLAKQAGTFSNTIERRGGAPARWAASCAAWRRSRPSAPSRGAGTRDAGGGVMSSTPPAGQDEDEDGATHVPEPSKQREGGGSGSFGFPPYITLMAC